ncbi:MAG: LysR family transcriptional regulator [Cellvibrio sp.]|uniref:LysR family transcriptional regulator n=1 Tax=Cellvibrio sp. TaxID=1965322 RepID=UPI0031A89CC9
MLNRLEMLRIFCAAAEATSFKEAAHRLGISPQAVTRAVKELEQLQGELLFHRNTRQVQVTQVGEELAAKAKERLLAVDDLFQTSAKPGSNELHGRVRITAPIGFGHKRLMPILMKLTAAHPQLDIDLTLSDERVDVVDEKIDIGVRIGFIRDSRFIARQLAKVYLHVVGTPDLIARVGAPVSIDSLNQMPVTGLIDRNTGRFWPWIFAADKQWTPTQPRLSSADTEAELIAVTSGLGFGQIPDFLASEFLAENKLKIVLEKFSPEPWDLYIYRPQRGPVPARIRLVFDTLVEALSE